LGVRTKLRPKYLSQKSKNIKKPEISPIQVGRAQTTPVREGSSRWAVSSPRKSVINTPPATGPTGTPGSGGFKPRSTDGIVQLTIKEAISLAPDLQTVNVYVQIENGREKIKTKTIPSKNPKFNEVFKFQITSPGFLKFSVCDKRTFSSDASLGTYVYDVKIMDPSQYGTKVDYVWGLEGKHVSQKLVVELIFTPHDSQRNVSTGFSGRSPLPDGKGPTGAPSPFKSHSGK